VDYIGLALAILKLVNFIMGYVDREQAKQDGRNEVIAEMALGIAKRVATKKVIQEKVDAMSDAEVDAGLRGLEPK
jgi:hypothetical protein